MSSQLAKRLDHIEPSPILSIAKRAMELKAEQVPVINLSLGEPDFDTPEHIKAAAIKAIEAGFTKYTAVEGILELRQAIQAKFKTDNGLDYSPKQIVVSNGAKQCLINLIMAVLNPGDEVILPAPYWASYPHMFAMMEAKNVILQTRLETHFKITGAMLEKAITPKTRLLVINSPSNPTGVAYSKEDLQALAQVLLKHPQVLIVTDDIYEHIYWGKTPFSNIVMVEPKLYDRTVIVHGVSKTYAMTGWRIGYAAGPQAIVEAMTTIQSQTTSNACSISQAAATAALSGSEACVTDMVKVFKERHDYFIEALNTLPGVKCLPCDGAFYAFASVDDYLKKNPQFKDDIALAEHVLVKGHVACVPGTVFGAPGHIRFSYALELNDLKQAIVQLKSCLGG